MILWRAIVLRLVGIGLTERDIRHHIRALERERARFNRLSMAIANELVHWRAALALLQQPEKSDDA